MQGRSAEGFYYKTYRIYQPRCLGAKEYQSYLQHDEREHEEKNQIYHSYLPHVDCQE